MIFLTTYPAHITFGDIVLNVIVWGGIIALYRNRTKSNEHAKAWSYITTFFGMLLLILGANYAKKSVKDWWSK